VGEPATFAALCATTADGDVGRAVVPPGWGQGRATLGGLVLAFGIGDARQRLPEPRPLRALAASFPTPAVPGAVDVRTRSLRHGRAVTHVQAEVTQAGAVACVMLASFGAPRPSAISAEPPPRPPFPPPEELPTLGAPGLAPEFTQHLDYRLAVGGSPYSGTTASQLGGWCRFRVPPGPFAAEHVVTLVDAWPSPAVARMTAPAPASTITWSLELLPIEEEIAASSWWAFLSTLESAGDGYAHGAAWLWSPAGRLAALSRQAVAIFG
jgi:acyl-CoA thioesterase